MSRDIALLSAVQGRRSHLFIEELPERVTVAMAISDEEMEA
jgi:hypothetical protein